MIFHEINHPAMGVPPFQENVPQKNCDAPSEAAPFDPFPPLYQRFRNPDRPCIWSSAAHGGTTESGRIVSRATTCSGRNCTADRCSFWSRDSVKSQQIHGVMLSKLAPGCFLRSEISNEHNCTCPVPKWRHQKMLQPCLSTSSTSGARDSSWFHSFLGGLFEEKWNGQPPFLWRMIRGIVQSVFFWVGNHGLCPRIVLFSFKALPGFPAWIAAPASCQLVVLPISPPRFRNNNTLVTTIDNMTIWQYEIMIITSIIIVSMVLVYMLT
jgi:hypothetical protein